MERTEELELVLVDVAPLPVPLPVPPELSDPVVVAVALEEVLEVVWNAKVRTSPRHLD